MFFGWLKRYVPRGLYGRAALILILPVVTLQLVVSVVFVQRHFEGVTEQLTRGVALELRLVLDRLEAAGWQEAGQVAGALRYRLRPVSAGAVPADDSLRFYDFSGRVVIRELDARLPGFLALELPDDFDVTLYAASARGPVALDFERERVSASNPHQLLVNMVVFGVIFTVIAFLYLRNQLRPITRLAEAAEAFGRGQVLPYKPSGAVEVRAAGRAFLDMRERIERHIEQRTMMLSGISHDLRTPLTRLRLGLSMLDAEDRAPLERDVEDIERLVDEFLSFARGEAVAGEAVATDPLALVREVVEDAARSGAPVTLAEVEAAGQVALRPLAVRRALENLIANAVRYATRAEVSVTAKGDMLCIAVEDDGPGIPPERRAEALKPFARLDPARNQDRGTGVGLGLAIAADVARAHGGALKLAESARLGGLRAELRLAR
ncbi:two-component sensor histidine kinase [Rhodosalinus halophilus]|uniref:histidine kinase n=1 Tax=Rhodosalinus halophilus TaxID=2259333 RepID=A0A365U9I6_9RHOB|nr:ATP-binding protein [Rhodosalinus halophilus]RBI84914.1 two-component sensor histidine kinase [Rhodosalinus halophilus]